MKRITYFLILLFIVSASSLSAQSANGLIGQARSEVNDCLQSERGPNTQILSTINQVVCVTEPCLIAWHVAFYVDFKCVGNDPCPAAPIRLIAFVNLDHEGNVVGSYCGSSSTE